MVYFNKSLNEKCILNDRKIQCRKAILNIGFQRIPKAKDKECLKSL